MLSTGRLFSPKPQKSRKPKLCSKSHCPLPAGRGTTSVGQNSQVKQIVEHLNQQGEVFSPKTEEGGQRYREPKPSPVIKHRPLPQPQCNRPSEETGKQEVQQKENIEDGQSVSFQGGRPAPEGMEMEAEVKRHEVEETGLGSAVSPHLFCRTSCTCICHQQRPGMRLVWVLADKEETRKEGKDAGSEGGRQRMSDRVTTRGETIEKSGQEEVMQFQKVPDAITRDWNSGECSQTPILNPPKFYHRSHWSTPACGNRQQTQLSPKISQKTPPPVPPRLDLQFIKFNAQNQGSHSSSSSSSSSSSPGDKISPLPKNSQLHKHPKPKHSRRFFSNPRPKSKHRLRTEEEIDESDFDDWEKVDLIREEEPSSSLPQGLSADLESCLKEEPLYQEYRAAAISKQIQHQAKCTSLSSTSSSEQEGPQDSGASLRASRGAEHSALWQELPSVRNSGVLAQMSSADHKRQESMFEVLTSEASYLRSLKVLTDHFLDSRDLDQTLIIRDKKTLFSNILRVREVSESLLRDLEERIGEGPVISDICDIIDHHAQHNFSPYIEYIRNQVYQEKVFSSLMQKNVQFEMVITRLQGAPVCQRLPFTSFLLLPFQRITRIKLLVENILKRTQEGTEEERIASRALASVSRIIEECNSEVGKMRQIEELLHVAQMLEFNKLKAIPLVSQRRFLQKRGELLEMTKASTMFNFRPKFTPVYLFLFNDLLIFTYKKSPDRYVVTDHAHRSLVHVQAISEEKRPSGLDHCFCLMLLENHRGCTYERLLRAPSESDMHRWMAVFPNLTNTGTEQEEVVYDDWDCPQVQCVQQYIAQQADELNLEPANIINVLRKTNEGWYEGVRLSDGKKGWFPAGNVSEITNEHVRRRNLREQYRIMRATSQTAPTPAQEPAEASGAQSPNVANGGEVVTQKGQ